MINDFDIFFKMAGQNFETPFLGQFDKIIYRNIRYAFITCAIIYFKWQVKLFSTFLMLYNNNILILGLKYECDI